MSMKTSLIARGVARDLVPTKASRLGAANFAQGLAGYIVWPLVLFPNGLFHIQALLTGRVKSCEGAWPCLLCRSVRPAVGASNSVQAKSGLGTSRALGKKEIDRDNGESQDFPQPCKKRSGG